MAGRRKSLGVGMLWLLPSLLIAQQAADSSGTGPVSGPEPISMGWLLVKTIGSLLLIIILIVAVIYFLKRMMGRQYGANGQNSLFRIIARMPIEPKQSLALVQVHKRVLLIGISESSITLLTEFDQDKELDQFVSGIGPAASGTMPGLFRNMVKKQVDR